MGKFYGFSRGGIMTTETKWERLLHDQLDCKDTNCEEEE